MEGRATPTMVPSSTMSPRPMAKTARPNQSRLLGTETCGLVVIECPFNVIG